MKMCCAFFVSMTIELPFFLHIGDKKMHAAGIKSRGRGSVLSFAMLYTQTFIQQIFWGPVKFCEIDQK